MQDRRTPAWRPSPRPGSAAHLLRKEPHQSRPRGARALHLRLHPCFIWNGNGRVGRFPDEHDDSVGRIKWTVSPVTDRIACVNALEKASVGENIAPFAD